MEDRCKDCLYYEMEPLSQELGFCGLYAGDVNSPFVLADQFCCSKLVKKEVD